MQEQQHDGVKNSEEFTTAAMCTKIPQATVDASHSLNSEFGYIAAK